MTTKDAISIRIVNPVFFRHVRWYVFFSIEGRDVDFLYYSHTSQPLRSLMYGKDFPGQLPHLLKKEDLCIECGLGLSIKGGVALDGGELIAWNITVDEANRILAVLHQAMGETGNWIQQF
ncbi:MAG: hypothetical protein GYA23_12135 [Methanomicrobiales archaeon]|nr:hypothetical protein [Methanomicrobiales archaeon]